ncbi:hypothetical protein [Owenweeksia hongkongensis]|uniref:hypothetical protein n=1 Tax=Owenweeksia hongkongensis TaxID=253245 RepID=UPI003A9284FD
MMGGIDTGQGYENEILFIDTGLNFISRKILPPAEILPQFKLISGDSLLYIIGGDMLNGKDLYVGTYSIEGDLIKDTFTPIALMLSMML